MTSRWTFARFVNISGLVDSVKQIIQQLKIETASEKDLIPDFIEEPERIDRMYTTLLRYRDYKHG